MSSPESWHIGTAAWTLPKEYAEPFGVEGSHLERYARLLNAVEINSSFYKEHKPATYRKWAEAVPENFEFSVKLSKVFTHVQKMAVDAEALHVSLQGIAELQAKWAVLLVQLPPSLQFESELAADFFELIRNDFQGPIALEPRHASWLHKDAVQLLKDYRLSKVIADPEVCPLADDRNFEDELVYLRLHGSPEIYKSAYEPARLADYARRMQQSPAESAWCIFDNTTFGHATQNALELTTLKKREGARGFLRAPSQSV